MTIGDWLAARRPAPPEALRDRLSRELAPFLATDAREMPAACLDAAERLVTALLAEGSTTRASALDLLTADALVTYAFEAASEAPAELAERATIAMRRIAALAAPA